MIRPNKENTGAYGNIQQKIGLVGRSNFFPCFHVTKFEQSSSKAYLTNSLISVSRLELFSITYLDVSLDIKTSLDSTGTTIFFFQYKVLVLQVTCMTKLTVEL